MGATSRRMLRLLSREANAPPGRCPTRWSSMAAGHFDQGTQRAILRLYRSAPAGRPGRRRGPASETSHAPRAGRVGRAGPLLARPSGPAPTLRLCGGAADVSLVPDAGHWPWLDRPGVVDDVAAFLDGRGIVGRRRSPRHRASAQLALPVGPGRARSPAPAVAAALAVAYLVWEPMSADLAAQAYRTGLVRRERLHALERAVVRRPPHARATASSSRRWPRCSAPAWSEPCPRSPPPRCSTALAHRALGRARAARRRSGSAPRQRDEPLHRAPHLRPRRRRRPRGAAGAPARPRAASPPGLAALRPRWPARSPGSSCARGRGRTGGPAPARLADPGRRGLRAVPSPSPASSRGRHRAVRALRVPTGPPVAFAALLVAPRARSRRCGTASSSTRCGPAPRFVLARRWAATRRGSATLFGGPLLALRPVAGRRAVAAALLGPAPPLLAVGAAGARRAARRRRPDGRAAYYAPLLADLGRRAGRRAASRSSGRGTTGSRRTSRPASRWPAAGSASSTSSTTSCSTAGSSMRRPTVAGSTRGPCGGSRSRAPATTTRRERRPGSWLAGSAYLREVWRSRDWRLFAVRRPAPLATGAARATGLGAESVTLRATRPGRVALRVRWTPYWAVVAGTGCVERDGEMTAVTARRPGTIRLAPRFDLARVGADGPRCSGR